MLKYKRTKITTIILKRIPYVPLPWDTVKHKNVIARYLTRDELQTNYIKWGLTLTKTVIL